MHLYIGCLKDADRRLEPLMVADWWNRRESPACYFSGQLCHMWQRSGDSCLYVCPVILSCYPAPWTAAPHTHTHTHISLVWWWGCSPADDGDIDIPKLGIPYIVLPPQNMQCAAHPLFCIVPQDFAKCYWFCATVKWLTACCVTEDEIHVRNKHTSL